jgi:hypothetical protein
MLYTRKAVNHQSTKHLCREAVRQHESFGAQPVGLRASSSRARCHSLLPKISSIRSAHNCDEEASNPSSMWRWGCAGTGCRVFRTNRSLKAPFKGA